MINFFEKLIREGMSFWQVPGSAISIVKDGVILMNKGFGKKHTTLSKNDDLDERTLFAIASLTKAFTSTVIGILVDEKKIQWDAPVKTYDPYFKLSDEHATEHMTLRDLLSFKSGLPGSYSDDSEDCSMDSRDVLIQKLSVLPFIGGFRTHFSYQNLCYSVLGNVIFNVTQQSWKDFIKERLLTPLDMCDTCTSCDERLQYKNVATPHIYDKQQLKPISWENLDPIVEAAGMSSSIADLSKWLLCLMQKGYYQNNPVIPPFVLAETQKPQTLATIEGFLGNKNAILQDVCFPLHRFLTYGMGWFIHDYRSIHIYQHPGLSTGMNALIAIVPEINLGVALLSNTESAFYKYALFYQIVDMYYGWKNDWNPHFLNIHNRMNS